MACLIFCLTISGFLSAYAENPTNGTIRYRQELNQLPQDLTPYDVLLSVPNCGLIGAEATLIAGGIEYPAIIFDCAGQIGHWWMIDNNIVAEVDFHFWMKRPDLIGTEKEVEVIIYPQP